MHLFIRVLTANLVITFLLTGIAVGRQLPQDQGQGPALSPAEALSKFRLADGFEMRTLLADPAISQPLSTAHDSYGRLWVVQYLQYPEPAGLKRLSRDNFWRTVYDSVPLPPGHGGVPGADKITVHEDRDGDGTLETETTFVDGLNIATSVVPTAQGAWVLNPPYLLFYADRDHDLKADGPPEVHLEGFGLEDTHSVVNSLCMGPDGWLYAAQGSTVSGSVRRYGSNETPKRSMGQAIWRYHPIIRKYEIFAEGGGNAFSVAFNDQGEVFSGHNGGDTRGFHYLQEAYYRKGFSKHGGLSNPNTFGYLDPMQHPPIQRFTHAMLMTEGTAFGKAMPHSMLAVDPLHGKLIQTELSPVGSTFSTKDVSDTVASDDKWFRPVAIQDGPDGAAYVCDWYDFQVAHLYAHVGKMDRDHGRVYRLKPTQASEASPWNATLANGTDLKSLRYLADRLTHPYRWQRWKARELLAQNPMRGELRWQVEAGLASGEQIALESLWTAHACGWIADTILANGEDAIPFNTLLANSNPTVRSWAIRLVCDDREVSPDSAAAIAKHAEREMDVKVLCQIASSAKRLPSEEALTIVSALLSRSLPENDFSLPLMIWWAVEPHSSDIDRVLSKLQWDEHFWKSSIANQRIAPNLIEIWAKTNSPRSMAAISQVLKKIGEQPIAIRGVAAKHANDAFERAFVGRSLLGVPDGVLDALISQGQPSLTLRLRRGDGEAKKQAMELLLDSKQAPAKRIEMVQLFGELHNVDVLENLIKLASNTSEVEAVRAASLSAMTGFETPEVPTTILKAWPELSPALRAVGGSVLGARKSWTIEWVEQASAGKVEAKSMPTECVRAMRLHNDEKLQSQIGKLYPGMIGPDLAQAQKDVTNLLERLGTAEGDPYRGKAQFKANCARCHKLYAEGGEMGPDLTGYQRDQLQALVRNIIAPSLEIREGYQTVGVRMEDGSVLTGFIENQNDEQITLKGVDGKSYVLEKSEVEQMLPQATSLMPEGMLSSLTDQQIADLLAYLRSSQPLSDG
jgi:putative heme-binding domain-containing protein